MQNQYWNGKYVLVTGAGGFIASHLVEALLQEGAWVRAFVRYNSRGQVGYLDEIRSKPGLETTIAWIAQNIDRYNPDRYSF